MSDRSGLKSIIKSEGLGSYQQPKPSDPNSCISNTEAKLNILPDNCRWGQKCDRYVDLMPGRLPSWEFLKANCPGIATDMIREFQRVDGFIPFENGFVYLIQAEGSNYYKIGKTINPDRRLLQIAPKMPFETRFVKVWRSIFMSEAEKMLHQGFKLYRANGEWFSFDDCTLDFLLSDFIATEIMYPCVMQWCSLIYGNRYIDRRKQEYRNVRSLCQMEEDQISDLFFLFNPKSLGTGDNAFACLSAIQYYFKSIAAEADPKIPIDIQEKARSAFIEAHGKCEMEGDL